MFPTLSRIKQNDCFSVSSAEHLLHVTCQVTCTEGENWRRNVTKPWAPHVSLNSVSRNSFSSVWSNRLPSQRPSNWHQLVLKYRHQRMTDTRLVHKCLPHLSGQCLSTVYKALRCLTAASEWLLTLPAKQCSTVGGELLWNLKLQPEREGINPRWAHSGLRLRMPAFSGIHPFPGPISVVTEWKFKALLCNKENEFKGATQSINENSTPVRITIRKTRWLWNQLATHECVHARTCTCRLKKKYFTNNVGYFDQRWNWADSRNKFFWKRNCKSPFRTFSTSHAVKRVWTCHTVGSQIMKAPDPMSGSTREH